MAKVQEVDVITGKTIKRDMTEDEANFQELARNENLAREAETFARAIAKTALLERLGITAEEATLLLS